MAEGQTEITIQFFRNWCPINHSGWLLCEYGDLIPSSLSPLFPLLSHPFAKSEWETRREAVRHQKLLLSVSY